MPKPEDAVAEVMRRAAEGEALAQGVVPTAGEVFQVPDPIPMPGSLTITGVRANNKALLRLTWASGAGMFHAWVDAEKSDEFVKVVQEKAREIRSGLVVAR